METIRQGKLGGIYMEKKDNLIDLVKQLEKAKDNCVACLKSNVLVDFKGLAYWANEVERLRERIKEIL